MSASAHRQAELPSKEFIADIVSHPTVIAKIYSMMVHAATSAKRDFNHIKNKHDVDKIEHSILPLFQPGVTRVNTEPTRSIRHFVDYEPKDMYVYGGSGLTLYYFALRGLTDGQSIDNRVYKRTSDIDLAWWPRVSPNVLVDDIMITSKSPAIIELVMTFKEHVQELFTNHRAKLLSFLKETLIHKQDIRSLSNIEVHHRHVPEAGVHKVAIVCSINHIHDIGLCEISIHDSGNSQKYDANQQEITTLLPLTEDPIYCDIHEGDTIHARTLLEVDHKKIPVPNLVLYCKQQALAFINLMHDDRKPGNKEKATNSFRRIVLIKTLLDQIQGHRHQREFKEKVGADDLKKDQEDINEIIDHIKYQFPAVVTELCQRGDASLQLLCSRQSSNRPLSFIMQTPYVASMMAQQSAQQSAQQYYQQIIKERTKLVHLMERIQQARARLQPRNVKIVPYTALLEKLSIVLQRVDMYLQQPNPDYAGAHDFLKKLKEYIINQDQYYLQLAQQHTIKSIAASANSKGLPPLPPKKQSLTNSAKRGGTRKRH